jgi:hypothetical protein
VAACWRVAGEAGVRLPLARAAVAATVGALSGALCLWVAYAIDPVLRIGFDTDLPRQIVSGVYPVERERETGLTFAWTQQEMALRLPGLDRSVDWIMELRVRSARVNPADNPDLTFFGDGVRLMTWGTSTDFETVQVTIPARADRRRRLLVTIQSSATMVPGAHDPRTLGVLVDSVTLGPAGRASPPGQVLAAAAATGGAVGGGLALAGLSLAATAAGLVMVSGAAAALTARGLGLYTAYATTMAGAAIWISALLVVGVLVVQHLRSRGLSDVARGAAAFSACALLLKLAVVLHPGMPVGDAMFHAHRFHDVLAGNVYFTSVAPGNYLFPYAPGLYVFSAPFAGLVPRGAADMALLRVIVLVVDTLAALALFAVVAHRWRDRRAALGAVVLYHLIPLEFRVVTVGNLTNVFAQALAVVALGMMASRHLGRAHLLWTGGLVFVLAAAFMSHTSTFPLLFLSAVLAGFLFLLRGHDATRASGWPLLLAVSAACVLAIAVYYAHFGETYRTEFARIGGETAAAAPDAGGRGIAARLETVPYYLRTYFGWPAMLLAVAGGWHLWHRGARDALTLVTAAWALACLLFLVIGVLTPVDMRYYLAAIPALALAGGIGASWLWGRGGASRALAIVLLTWAAAVGVWSWWNVL